MRTRTGNRSCSIIDQIPSWPTWTPVAHDQKNSGKFGFIGLVDLSVRYGQLHAWVAHWPTEVTYSQRKLWYECRHMDSRGKLCSSNLSHVSAFLFLSSTEFSLFHYPVSFLFSSNPLFTLFFFLSFLWLLFFSIRLLILSLFLFFCLHFFSFLLLLFFLSFFFSFFLFFSIFSYLFFILPSLSFFFLFSYVYSISFSSVDSFFYFSFVIFLLTFFFFTSYLNFYFH